ncbi:hypothetical protein AB0M94_26940 [Streptomyces xanthochromogenes]|uniref:MerR family transcriptional regulator n=1 Tax=Streptomyces xanthochromogenes TaxID=67384 RepID=A0ABQ3A397_9ACTN|nr:MULTISPECIES: hypothetical protein [Streptomyces]MYV90282.1 hypothetical protein [Streptomyces sp. SID1034]GGY31685.1 hypothetical protein GCM10010326_26850 [Streptomyces xanthochromogenes]
MSTTRTARPAGATPLYPPTTALITTAMAAEEAAVAPGTIRKWVQLGHIAPAGRSGRSHLFRLADVFAAERATRRAHELRA